MTITIRPAVAEDVDDILTLVNRYAGQNLMLPRTENSVRQSLADWLVAIETDAGAETGALAGCGALVPLTDTLVEIRSLAVAEGYQGQGVGGQLVRALVAMAREQEYAQVCALTLRENFFVRLGFSVVDRWSISPKVWQACIYCSKFHRCDEIAVLMNLVENPATVAQPQPATPAWNSLLQWEEWQPLKLAYRTRDDDDKLTG